MALLWRFSLLGAFAVLLSVSASSQSLPRAPKTEVITVTPKPIYFSEPSIAVNPAKPQQVVAAFQDNAHIAYSVDGGRHWQLATGIEPPNYRVSGDVSVLSTMKDAPTFVTSPSISSARLIIGAKIG